MSDRVKTAVGAYPLLPTACGEIWRCASVDLQISRSDLVHLDPWEMVPQGHLGIVPICAISADAVHHATCWALASTPEREPH